MTTQQSENERSVSEELEKMNKKVHELTAPITEDLEKNKLGPNDTGVENYHNSWVVKPHAYTRTEYDFSID